MSWGFSITSGYCARLRKKGFSVMWNADFGSTMHEMIPRFRLSAIDGFDNRILTMHFFLDKNNF